MKVINIKDFCIPAEDASYDELSNFADEIAELATYPIDAEPVRHGYWSHKQVDTTLYHVYGQCSECKERHRIDNYCPNCGAKMYDPCEDCQEFSCDYCPNRRARMEE